MATKKAAEQAVALSIKPSNPVPPFQIVAGGDPTAGNYRPVFILEVTTGRVWELFKSSGAPYFLPIQYS